MCLLTHPKVVIPMDHEIWQIAVVRARRLAIRHIAAAVGD